VAYELYTFHDDYTLTVYDNTQNGNNTYTSLSFGDITGQWRCLNKKNEVLVRSVNYNYPYNSEPNGAISYNNPVRLTFYNNWKNVRGTFKYADYNLGTNPLDKNNIPIQTVPTAKLIGTRLDFFPKMNKKYS
ncbi:unnamed protein product, partial [Didymodactylos carnosus]